MEDIKNREVVRRITLRKEYTFFVQALLEDTHIVAVSLGEKEEITIFYDKANEEYVDFVLQHLDKFCKLEFVLN